MVRDALDHAGELLLTHASYSQDFIDFGREFTAQRLTIAEWQREISTSSARFYGDELSKSRLTVQNARAAVAELQKQAAALRDTVGVQASSPDALSRLESKLEQARLEETESKLHQSYLARRLTSVRSDLQQVDRYIDRTQTRLSFFVHIAPNQNFAYEFGEKAIQWTNLGKSAFELFDVDPSQPAEKAHHQVSFLWDLTQTVLRNVSSIEFLGPPVALYQSSRELRMNIRAQEHQTETERLAFGGVLSQAKLPSLTFAPPEGDLLSGTFSAKDSSARLSSTGVWTSQDGFTADRFNAAGRYTFDHLDTPSGRVVTGYGNVSRVRIEWHDAIINPFSLVNLREIPTVTETTRRHESYNETFGNQDTRQPMSARASPQIEGGIDFRMNKRVVGFPPASIRTPEVHHSSWPSPSAAGSGSAQSSAPVPLPAVPGTQRPSCNPASTSSREAGVDMGRSADIRAANTTQKKRAPDGSDSRHVPSGVYKRGGVVAF